MNREILVAMAVALLSISACTTSRVLTLSTGETWRVANLPCDARVKYSGYSVTVKDIGLPTGVPDATYTIGEVGFSRQKLEEATARVKELDAIQYRMCQQTNALIAVSDNDELVAKYLESSDKTFVQLVDLLRQFDASDSEEKLDEVTEMAEDVIDEKKKEAEALPRCELA